MNIVNIGKYIFDKILLVFNRLMNFSIQKGINTYIAFFVFYFITGGSFIGLGIRTWYETKAIFVSFDWLKLLSILADIAGLFSVAATMIFAFLRRRSYRIKENRFKAAFRKEIQNIIPLLEKLDLDILDADVYDFLLRKCTPIYIDLFDQHDDISFFQYDFYRKLILFFANKKKLSKVMTKFLNILILNDNPSIAPLFRRDYSKDNYLSSGSQGYQAIILYKYFKDHLAEDKTTPFDYQNMLSSINSAIDASDIYYQVFEPENTILYKTIKEKKSLEISDALLSHVMEKSYTLINTNDDNTPVDLLPLILVKNSEDLSYFWKPLNEQIRIEMKKTGEFSEEDIKNYNLPRDSKVKIASPFFDALRDDPYFIQLPNYKQSPVFMLFPEEFPRPCKFKPVKYIDTVLRKQVKSNWANVLKSVTKVYPYLEIPKKELVLDYELFPFDPQKIDVHSRNDRIPTAFSRLVVSRVLKGENKNEFFMSKLVELNSLLAHIGPFGLITKSTSKVTLEEIKSYELKFLKVCAQKNNGPINFEGVKNISMQKRNAKKISEILYSILHNQIKSERITKKKSLEIVNEIISNADYLHEKLSQ